MKEQLISRRFGKLLVISKSSKKGNRRQVYWDCICDCGSYTSVSTTPLKLGKTKSCGCLRKTIKHGFCGTKIYRTWSCATQRCDNPNNDRYLDYGGRGIKFLWPDFMSFKNDMYQSFLEHITKYGEMNTQLDRIDNNGNYCKENCRWTTRQGQQNNRRTNHMIEFNGQLLNVTQWAYLLNISKETLRARISRGWSIERALTTP